MVDSSFFLPPDKRDRLATVYVVRRGRQNRAGAGEGDGPGRLRGRAASLFSGGAGLLSTAGDYTRFLQMLLNGGELDGVRLLGPKSVEMMTSNQVGRLYREDGSLGFGLGFETTEDVGAAGRPDSLGAYGWGSAYYSKDLGDSAGRSSWRCS